MREAYAEEVDNFRQHFYLVRREIVYHRALWIRPGQGAESVYWVRSGAREMQQRFNEFFADSRPAGDMLSVSGELLLGPNTHVGQGVRGDVLFNLASVDHLGRFHAR